MKGDDQEKTIQKLMDNPMNGALYLFRNRSRTSIKVLFYNGVGFWLCQLRLSSGRLKWWPKSTHQKEGSIESALLLGAREIMVMLSHGDPMAAQFTPEWKNLE